MKKGVDGTIYLFRHGQTTYNRDGRFTGTIDAKLTKKGKLHAATIAKKLKNKKIDVAIHTHLSRSIDTLRPVLNSHPEIKFVLQDDRMIERSYGILAGTTHEEFISRIGKQEYDLRIHGDALTDITNPKLIKWIKNFLGTEEYKSIHRGWNVKAPGGESFADVERRVKKFLRDLMKFIRKNRVNVAISAHGNSIRLFRKIIERASKEAATKWVIPYDKVFEYRV